MPTVTQKLSRQLEAVLGFSGAGRVSYDYGKSADSTHHLLSTLFGEGSPEETGFLEIGGEGAERGGLGGRRDTYGSCLARVGGDGPTLATQN